MSRYTPLDEINKLPVEVIKNFRKTGKSSAINIELQDYIRHLDRVSEIWNIDHEHNVTRIAKRLQETFPALAFNTARDRVYDAFNYFYLNSTVKAAAWDNYYADRMEDAAKVAMAAKNLGEARRFYELAREYRQQASINNINPDDVKPMVVFISPEVMPERLGLKDFNLKLLWADTNKFIDKLPVDERTKQLARNDAALNLGIEDAEYEDMD